MVLNDQWPNVYNKTKAVRKRFCLGFCTVIWVKKNFFRNSSAVFATFPHKDTHKTTSKMCFKMSFEMMKRDTYDFWHRSLTKYGSSTIPQGNCSEKRETMNWEYIWNWTVETNIFQAKECSSFAPWRILK